MFNYEITKAELEKTLNSSSFIKKKTFLVGGLKAVIYFSDGICDIPLLDEFVIEPLTKKKLSKRPSFSYLRSVLPHVDMSPQKSADNAVLTVFDGDALLLLERMSEFCIISAKKWDKRAIIEPPTSTVIKGPREGFTEDLIQNISMTKRRLKTPLFKIDFVRVGKMTRTQIGLLSIDGVADSKILKKIKEKLQSISIDGIIDSSYLRQYLSEKKFSFFRQVGDTEKPDVLAAKLLEGRIGIIVDGSPIALTLPFLLIEDYQSPEDYYAIPHHATFLRILRLVAMLFGVFMPGFYVAAQIFHIQFLPLQFLITISTAVKGIPLSPNLEMLFTLFIFELLNEASIRMPKYVGTAMSIVGAIVLGDTAVKAGIISTPTILITALSGIAVYAVPDQRNTLSILRIIFLMLCGSFGVVGFVTGVASVSIYLCKLESFGVPYLSPLSPRVPADLQDGFFKSPMTINEYRPESLHPENKRRLSWKN